MVNCVSVTAPVSTSRLCPSGVLHRVVEVVAVEIVRLPLDGEYAGNGLPSDGRGHGHIWRM